MWDDAEVFAACAFTALFAFFFGVMAGVATTASTYQKQAVGYGYAKFDPVSTKFEWKVPVKTAKGECE